MTINLEIDKTLIDEAKALGKQKTKSAVIVAALQEYIQRRRQAQILDLFGTIEYDSDYDYKEQRNRA